MLTFTVRCFYLFFLRSIHERGNGVSDNACPSSHPDKNGALCYPKCRSGYHGVGKDSVQSMLLKAFHKAKTKLREWQEST